MYNVKKIGYIVMRKREFRDSELWKIWRAVITKTTCAYCASLDGKILSEDDLNGIKPPPVHPNCKCAIEALKAIKAGTATDDGMNGVDMYISLYGELPDCYIDSKSAQNLGWEKLDGNLAEVLPGRIIGGDIFENRKRKLPEKAGRIWYEADFDYESGYRNSCRVLYSNDGLVFVTYDHYMSFYEIVMEE